MPPALTGRPDGERTLELDAEIDLPRTLAPLAHGRADPTIRIGRHEVWRATRTSGGPVTLRLELRGRQLHATVWGPGSEPALEGVEALAGGHDDPTAFVPRHPVLRDAERRLRGLRLTRSDAVLEALVPAVLEQKVTGIEARRVWRALIARHGEPAPGPGGLRLAPAPSVLAALPYYAYHRLGLERRRAEVIRSAASVAERLEETTDLPLPVAYRRLRAINGIGPWTAAEVGRVAFGDPDAISVGDFHVPNLVCWALAAEPRGDDSRMLELLATYRGQRGRVQRLLEASGIRPPRYGPRMTPRRIAHI
jgi:3-methyladenine DNA glycosylase/8-oxoguanine DNA glycosylase